MSPKIQLTQIYTQYNQLLIIFSLREEMRREEVMSGLRWRVKWETLECDCEEWLQVNHCDEETHCEANWMLFHSMRCCLISCDVGANDGDLSTSWTSNLILVN